MDGADFDQICEYLLVFERRLSSYRDSLKTGSKNSTSSSALYSLQGEREEFFQVRESLANEF